MPGVRAALPDRRAGAREQYVKPGIAADRPEGPRDPGAAAVPDDESMHRRPRRGLRERAGQVLGLRALGLQQPGRGERGRLPARAPRGDRRGGGCRAVAFNACLDRRPRSGRGRGSDDRGRPGSGSTPPPRFYLGGQQLVGLKTAAELGALIDAELAKATASRASPARGLGERRPLTDAGPARSVRGPLGLPLVAVTLVGLAVAGYLAVVRVLGESAVCGPSRGCETVAASEYSVVAGIPVAVWGVPVLAGRPACAMAWWRSADRRVPASRLRAAAPRDPRPSPTSRTWSCS